MSTTSFEGHKHEVFSLHGANSKSIPCSPSLVALIGNYLYFDGGELSQLVDGQRPAGFNSNGGLYTVQNHTPGH